MKRTRAALAVFAFCFVFLPHSFAAQEETASIDGLVVNLGTNEPLAGVRVEAVRAEGRSASPPGTAETGDDGRFRLTGLPPGRYRLTASRPLFYAPPRQPVIVALSAGNTAARLGLWPTATISGRVLDENRDPLDRVRVEAVREQYRSNGTAELAVQMSVTSNEKGEYRLFGLQAGTYYLRATKPGTRSMEYFYPGLLERDRTASVRVAAGVELSGTDMSLPAVKIQTVRLKVEGLPADDRFAFEFVVMRKGAKNTTPVRTETQHLGDRVFRVSAIPAGTYEIAARFQGISAARQVYTGVLALSIPAEREGAEIDAGTMAARLDGFRITGKIVGTEYRVPSSGGSKTYPLLIRQMDGGMWSNGGIEITDEGTFVLSNVPRGRYQIVFTPLPAGLFLTAVHYGGRDILDTGFILEGEPVGPVEIVLGNASALGVVEGAVRTAEDEPAPFSAVVLIPPVGRQENPDAFRFTQADENGRFSIRNLLPGDYRVVAVADLEPYAYLAPEFSTNVGVRGERVTVNAGSLATITARVIPASN